MKAGASKSKGSSFERDICKQLSRFVSKGEKTDCFWRSAMSGGRATVAQKRGEVLNRQAGDICAVAPEGHAITDNFYLELKAYNDLRLDSFIFKKVGPLTAFWKHTKLQAKKYGKRPAMIIRTNRLPILLMLDRPNVLIGRDGPKLYDTKSLNFRVLMNDGTAIYDWHEVICLEDI